VSDLILVEVEVSGVSKILPEEFRMREILLRFLYEPSPLRQLRVCAYLVDVLLEVRGERPDPGLLIRSGV
jgi:hypothetical protein